MQLMPPIASVVFLFFSWFKGVPLLVMFWLMKDISMSEKDISFAV
jgi:hypothetical protein